MRSTEENCTPKTPRLFFVLLLLVATILLSMVVFPIAKALFCAAILASALWPLRMWLAKRLGGRRALTAAVLVVLVVVVLFGPLLAFSAIAIREVASGLGFLVDTLKKGGEAGFLGYLPKSLADFWRIALAQVPARVEGELMSSFGRQLSAQGGNAAMALGATLSATATVAVQSVLFLVALYFFLLQGDELINWVDGVLPLNRGHFRELLVEFKQVANSILVSSLVTSAIQAAAALLGYLTTSLPYPGFFTAATFFCAFIPAFGAAGVTFLASLLLLVTGHPYAAVLLAIWGFAVVGSVDNLVRPLLIRSGLHINGAIVFFAFIGGLSAFGAIGLILGPLAVSLFLALLRIYKRDFGLVRLSDGADTMSS